MAKHRPSVTWMLRPFGVRPNGYVQTCDTSKLDIVIEPFGVHPLEGDSDRRLAICLPRSDARLLAKRILQCLEETK